MGQSCFSLALTWPGGVFLLLGTSHDNHAENARQGDDDSAMATTACHGKAAAATDTETETETDARFGLPGDGMMIAVAWVLQTARNTQKDILESKKTHFTLRGGNIP